MSTFVSASCGMEHEESQNFLPISEKYGLDGGLSEENVLFLCEKYNGALHICQSSEGTNCIPEGFEHFKKHFKAAKNVPLNPQLPEYKPETADKDPERAVLAFKRYAEALDDLPLPTVIVCKSATRASAVYAAYKGVKENLSKEEMFAFANEKGLKFISNAGLRSWVGVVLDRLTHKSPLFFRQLFESTSSTYTYLLADSVSKEALLIDPVLETVERDSNIVTELGLTLKYVVNTHCHADHITGTGKLKGIHPGCRSAIAAASTADADVKLQPFDVLQIGSRSVKAFPTPGHTEGCLSYVLDDLSMVFTGDALLIRGCGRTDFQGGSAKTLYASVHTQLFGKLPDSCTVYPAHDYKGCTASTIGEEKRLNPRLTKSEEEFVSIMDNLNLPNPKKLEESVPANLVCGLF